MRYDDGDNYEDEEPSRVNTKSLSPYRNPSLIRPIKSK